MNKHQLESERLVIRTFNEDDLLNIHRILDLTFGDGTKLNDRDAIQERKSWLQWNILNQKWLHQLDQPPYGDRAIVLKEENVLIGSVGFVPQLDAYEQIPELSTKANQDSYNTPEVGLFWAIDPNYQRMGYATEAVELMIDYAFKCLKLKRIIACTEYENLASQGVMKKVGMTITRNPLPDPVWLQIVGFLVNPDYN